MKNNILRNPRFYISVLLVVFFFFFVAQVPYIHDDWQGGIHSKWLLMLNGFANYNGIYLGNLFEILITRSVLMHFILYYFFVVVLSVILMYIYNDGLKMKMFMIYGSSVVDVCC